MSKAILLADDSVTIQKVIELTFMDQDYQIEAVSSGDEALRRLSGGIPDLVIADVHMPGASGFDVAKRSKEMSPDTPVLLLVGTFEPFDEGDFTASGADEVLKKPFDSQELLRLVEKLLPAEEAVEALPPVAEEPKEEPVDLEDTGVFSLDDDAFEGSSQVQPPADLAASDAPLVAGLAWDEPEALEEVPLEVEEEVDVVAVAEEEDAGFQDADELDADELDADELDAEEAGAEEDEAEDDDDDDDEDDDEESVALPAGILSDEDVERIAVRVAHLVGEKLVRDVAWDVIPDLAEVIIKRRLQELESEVE